MLFQLRSLPGRSHLPVQDLDRRHVVSGGLISVITAADLVLLTRPSVHFFTIGGLCGAAHSISASASAVSATSRTASCGAGCRRALGPSASSRRPAPSRVHPSQLYQFALEGVVLFIIPEPVLAQGPATGASPACSCCSARPVPASWWSSYASLTVQLGLYFQEISMGQILSHPDDHHRRPDDLGRLQASAVVQQRGRRRCNEGLSRPDAEDHTG